MRSSGDAKQGFTLRLVAEGSARDRCGQSLQYDQHGATAAPFTSAELAAAVLGFEPIWLGTARMLSRRANLTTGTASVALFGLGGAWWATTGPAKTAREPWRAASKGFGDPRLDVLAFAILAPNPHNMQPWRIQLGDAGAFTLYCDLERLLPETDPPNRQVTVGFGCFLELCRQAAAAGGYRMDTSYFPDGEPQPLLDERPIAHVELVADARVRPDPLFSTVLERRTNRLEFDLSRAIDTDALAQVQAATIDGVNVFASADSNLVDELRNLAVAAWDVEWSTASTRRESIEVMHIGGAAVDAKPWGVSIDDRLSSTVAKLGMMSPAALPALRADGLSRRTCRRRSVCGRLGGARW